MLSPNTMKCSTKRRLELRNQLKSRSFFVFLLAFLLVTSYVIPVNAAVSAQADPAGTTPWQDSIPEMLAAGKYEEGVVIAGIDMSGAKHSDEPGSALGEKKLGADTEPIMTVDSEAVSAEPSFHSEPSWFQSLKDSLTGGSHDEVAITSIRRGDMTTEQILRLLAEEDSVVFAEPNYITEMNTEDDSVPASGPSIKGDAGQDRDTTAPARDVTAIQWSSSADSTLRAPGTSGNPSMNVPGWPDGSNMDHEIIVAVIDYPVDFNNPDLADRAYTFSPELQEKLGCDKHGFNATWESKDGKLEYFEDGDHGTHVAGIIGASWDGHGINGVGSNVRIVSVQNANEDGLTSLVNVLRAMNFVRETKENGVDIRITNNSWGLFQNSKALDAAVTELGENGILSLFAAGNDSQDLNKMPNLVGTLAENPYTIIVASADVSGHLADSSNYGKGIVTLAAPGVEILSCMQTIQEGQYIPAMASENKYYENFENDSISLKIYQIDPQTGEKLEGTDGVVVRADEAMGFEGGNVLKVPVNHEYTEEIWYGPACTFRLEFDDAEALEFDPATDSFGFAFGSANEVGVMNVSGYEEWFFGLWSHRSSWSMCEVPLGEMERGSEPYVTISMDVSTVDEVYFDTIGIGNEKHPYGLKSGTSMASPAAAGAAAVIASRHYEEISAADADSAKALAGYVRSSVRMMPALADKVSTGGIIDLSVDATAADPDQQPAPDITDVSVSGTEVTLTGSGFGSSGGMVTVKPYVTGKESAELETAVSEWSDGNVTLSLNKGFQGILEAELTTSNGKKDTMVKFISKSRNLFETDLSIVSDTGDPFAFDAPDKSYPDAVRMGDSESSGIMMTLGDQIYYMPVAAEVEKEPAYRSLYCYDLSTDTWSTCPAYPKWIAFASGTGYDGKLYVKGLPTDTDETGNISYYDDFDLLEKGEVCIYSYTPGDSSWEECSTDEVYPEQTLFTLNDRLMLAGSVYVPGESDEDLGYSSNLIWSYDPEKGADEILGTVPPLSENPIVTCAFGHIFITSRFGDLLYELGEDLSAENAVELDTPLKDNNKEEYEMPKTDSTHFSLAGNDEMLVLIWSDIRDGSADTYILKKGESSFSPYNKRVSDATVFGPASVIRDGRLYVTGSSAFEPENRLFRSTLLKERKPSSGGGSHTVTYPVNLAESIENGNASVSMSRIQSGKKVTVTLQPDEGYQTKSVTVTDKNGQNVEISDITDDTFTFTMPDSAVTITPVFTKIQEPGGPDDTVCPRDDTCPITPFTDTDKNEWYHDGVHWAIENSIMNGTGVNTFEPLTTTTRAMIVTMLWRMEGSPQADGTASFRDVPDRQWYTDAVRWAAASGIVYGYDEDTFGPDDSVTREQLATILYRSVKAKGQGFTGTWAFPLNFDDADQVSEWADEAMHWMVMNGIIQGMSDKELSPQGDALRAQVATMLMRFSQQLQA